MLKVFIDMDGVIADFVAGVFKLYNYTDPCPIGEYDPCKIIGKNIWPELTEQFWIDLPKTPEADKIMELVQRHEHYICTSPTLDPMCASGKLKWLKKHYPHIGRKYFITPHKHLLAGKNRLLIDDSDDNVFKWDAEGGMGFMIPRPWNCLHKQSMITALAHLSNILG